MKQFTDTEMLDWMLEREVRVCNSPDNNTLYLVRYKNGFSLDYKSPREAVTAEMNREGV